MHSGLPPVTENFDFIKHYYGILSPIELVSINSRMYMNSLYSNALGFTTIGIQGSKFIGETDKYTEFVIDDGVDSSLKMIEPLSEEECLECQRINNEGASLSNAYTEEFSFMDNPAGYKEVDSIDFETIVPKLLITEIKGVSSFEYFLYLKALGYRHGGGNEINYPRVFVSSDFKNSIYDKKPIANFLPVEEDINEYINRANSVSMEFDGSTIQIGDCACVRTVITDLDPNCSYFIISGQCFLLYGNSSPSEVAGEIGLLFPKDSKDMNCSFDPTQVLASRQAVVNIPSDTEETE